MGGTTHVESKAGEGSRFSFDARFEYSTMNAFVPDKELGFKFLRVLLICDHAEMNVVLQNQLEQLKFIVRVAKTENEVLQKYSNNRYDLVLIDWSLKEGDPFELAAKFKFEHAAPAQVLVMVSAYHEQRLHELDSRGVFEKIIYYPISQSQLFNEICSLYKTQISQKHIIAQDQDRKERFNLLRHSHILLVEDNEINQEVAKAILSDMDIQLDVANNGAEAVAMAGLVPYDAILMDLQMPVMDGYEATRLIREKLGGDTPIIAMTADAMKGIKERVLEVGMDAYITKPFDSIELFSVLQRVIQSSRLRGGQRQVAAAFESEQEEQEGAVQVLQVEKAVSRLGNNKHLYRQLLQEFMTEHGDSLDWIRYAIDRRELENAQFLAHKLKEAAIFIGAYELAIAVEKVEYALINQENPSFALTIMQHKFEEALASIEGEISKVRYRR
ncbi:polar amino acid transport system substrate-binding protein [Paenibacillus taihuensis]|uniref:Polar amino acid transport system substrate-binding protein n=1 Tax=Paenibacillus taihuensis TaxID=1156355 RepID=A0A3D9QX13_9BACL|nr:response regulator [Paenibacillus taihuensis]REE70527.1 polar amino acid transport system substrate-binding protein [Paenibacillus taihuensis]